ncbi:kinase-like domain-containing protein [Rhizophagus diaphanus]|nr:kinase-like domain-containing protein [Rhizophagus diaphanus] [Rhizophagus sp. MUCL 43196]
MSYAKKGSLRKCLPDIIKFEWQVKLKLLKKIILGLKVIHQSNLTHGDFHDGNILMSDDYNELFIIDLGLCKPISDLQGFDNKTNEIYGVLPYMAPEILRKKPYTPASDIYSFSMIMWEFTSGIPPFNHEAHDCDLILDICKKEKRPEIINNTPKCYKDLMKKCWDSNPSNRPTIIMLENIMTECSPLYWNRKVYIRPLGNMAVILKYLDNAQNELLDEIISYYNKLQIYGISQNPSTKDYILVLNQEHFKKVCNKCANKYVNTDKWCEACQKGYLKENFTNWTSDNKQIDRLIQEMQLKINDVKDIIFEWIPYNQFYDIKEIGKGGFAKVYSARWKNGPLYWNRTEYARDLNKTVALKCLNNSQNISNKFLNEVKAYSINNLNNIDSSGEILKIFGISQNPNTKDYIMSL